MLKNLVKSLEESPIVKRGEYNYFVHPITDGIPSLDPALLREIAVALVRVLDLADVDRIVTAEAMGIHIGSALSLITDIPLVVMRKRPYGLPGEIAVHQETGYSKGELYLNGIEPGDRVVIVDDVCSTGGTMQALIGALRRARAEVVDTCVVIKRGDPKATCPFKALVSIEVTHDGVHVVDTCF
jgi:adenine phosphoribosyltransferase